MQYLTNVLSLISTNITKFFSMCRTFFQSIIDFFNNIWNILEWLRFWLKTLLSGLRTFIQQVFEWQLFSYLYSWFNDLVGRAWYAGAFIAWFLFLVFVRIAIAFVFKLFRLNVDYRTPVKIYDQKDRIIK